MDKEEDINKPFDKKEKEWLINLIKKDLVRKETPKEKVKTVRPKSKIQFLFREFYSRLRNGDSADCLDKFYEEELRDYQQKSLFANVIVTFAKRLKLNKISYPYDEDDYQKLFFAIAEKKMEEPIDTMGILLDMINKEYPSLISEELEPNEEKDQNDWELFANSEVENLRENIEQNREQYKEEYARIEKTKKTKIELLAERLNNIILLGKDNWELILYSILSTYSPKIKINSIPTRNNLHLLLVGDISTAKSKLYRMLNRISPKSDIYNDVTKPSLEGIATNGGIEQGIIDYCNNGMLILPEFNNIYEFSLLRDILDSDKIKIAKRGNIKEVELNINLFCASNPINDFFQNEIKLRKQIGFSEGILSRFDILIPLMNSIEKNELIISKMDIFSSGNNGVDLEGIGEVLNTLAIGMERIKSICLSENQKLRLKETFLAHNSELEERPLLIPRDLELLARLVNVIVCSNFYEREVKNGVLYANDKDIEKAIAFFEHLIVIRKQLYTSIERHIFTIEDRILMEIVKANEGIKANDLVELVTNQNLCGRATVYRKIKQLVRDGKIVQKGLRNMELSMR